MQRDNDNQDQPKTYCTNCGRHVLTQNFLIHQGRCQKLSELKSSRVSERSEKKPQSKHKNQINERDSSYSLKNLPKERIFTNIKKKKQVQPISQNEQKIPCYFCGYSQSLQQLDEHPKRCPHWQIECNHCKGKFPKSLMNDHRQVCQQNPSNIQRSQRNYERNIMRRNDQEQNFQSQQENQLPLFTQRRNRNLYQPSPLMSLFQNILENNPPERRPAHQNQINFLGFSIHNSERPQFILRSNSTSPDIFIRLIEILTSRVNPNRNPGLNSEQLSQLKKVKYHKKGQQSDLCTICYCQFQETEDIIELNCKHIFHQECIFEWLKRVSNCPVCKKSMSEQNNNQRVLHNQNANHNRNVLQQQMDMEEEHFRY